MSNLGKAIAIKSFLKNVNDGYSEISINIMDDGYPRAVAFFDIDKTLAELRFIHGQAIRELFKEFLEQDFPDIEEVYFKGFRLGNSFREFDRMDGIYHLGHKEWIDPEVYKRERLSVKMKDIDNEGSIEHKLSKMYLDRYVEIASKIALETFQKNKDEFEQVKIKPVFALVRLYKTLGIPMFAMTANGRIFAENLIKYLGLSEFFIDVATDEDMVGGGKELVIPKLIDKLENLGIPVPKDKIVVVGDSLFGDIGSGFRFKDSNKDGIFIKGILVLKNRDELNEIKNQIKNNPDLKKIVENTDVEAFIFDEVKLDQNGVPIILPIGRNFLIKLI